MPGLRQSQVPWSWGHISIRSRCPPASSSSCSSSRRHGGPLGPGQSVRRQTALVRHEDDPAPGAVEGRHGVRGAGQELERAPGSSTYPATRAFRVPSRSRKTMSQGAAGAARRDQWRSAHATSTASHQAWAHSRCTSWIRGVYPLGAWSTWSASPAGTGPLTRQQDGREAQVPRPPRAQRRRSREVPLVDMASRTSPRRPNARTPATKTCVEAVVVGRPPYSRGGLGQAERRQRLCGR